MNPVESAGAVRNPWRKPWPKMKSWPKNTGASLSPTSSRRETIWSTKGCSGVCFGASAGWHIPGRSAFKPAAGLLLPYMKSEDPNLRGLAVWAVGPVLNPEAIQHLKGLARDPAGLMLYRAGRLLQYSVGRLALEALAKVEQRAKA